MYKQWGLALAGLVWLIGLSPTSAEPDRHPMTISWMNAVEAAGAARVIGHSFQCTGRIDELRRGRRTSVLGGPEAGISVDQETGLPVEYSSVTEFNDPRARSSNTSETSKVTASGAFDHATSFLRSVGVEPNGAWTLESNSHTDFGNGFGRYYLRWRKVVEGVELPALIDMTVNDDDGHVASYMLIDDPVVVPLQTNMTGEQALALVAEKKNWARPIVKKARLEVWYVGGYPGPQALMWRFEVANPDAKTGSDSYVWADVNATTGQIVRLDGPAGFFGPMPKGQKAVSVALPKPDLGALRGAKPPPTVFQLAKLRQGKKAK